MSEFSIVRILDNETFFISAGKSDKVHETQCLEVLTPLRTAKNVAYVVEAFDDYAICKKVGEQTIAFGDIVKLKHT